MLVVDPKLIMFFDFIPQNGFLSVQLNAERTVPAFVNYSPQLKADEYNLSVMKMPDGCFE